MKKPPVITLRTTPDLHARIKAAAWSKGVSMNQYLIDRITAAVAKDYQEPLTERKEAL